MQTLKARGHRGDWFARIGDEDIPCVWLEWLTGTHYRDPGANPNEGKWPKYIEAVHIGRKVALTGKRKGKEWIREGYIALFSVRNVVVSDAGLEFDLADRLANLK
jgi:hypothetical protein